jgi:hypothetical protein
MDAGASLCRLDQHLLHANSPGDCREFQTAASEFLFERPGKLEKIPGAGYQITEVILKPRVVIASAGDLGRIPTVLEKAKETCFISNSVKSTVKLEPQVYHRGGLTTEPKPE